MDEINVLPPPDDPRPMEKDSICRLWIGNLDPNLTEYALVKILQQTGVTLKHFDFLYHKAGPEKGRPRGYCFITVASSEEAEKLLKRLNGMKVLCRRLIVKLAHANDKSDEQKKTVFSAPSVSDVSQDETSRESKIKAIEAKLRLMEENSDVSVFIPPPPVSKPDSVYSSHLSHCTGHRKDSYVRRDRHPRKSFAPYVKRRR